MCVDVSLIRWGGKEIRTFSVGVGNLTLFSDQQRQRLTVVSKYVCAYCHRNHYVVILCFLAYVFSSLGIQQLKSDGLLSECKVFHISSLAHPDDLSQTVCHSLLFTRIGPTKVNIFLMNQNVA